MLNRSFAACNLLLSSLLNMLHICVLNDYASVLHLVPSFSRKVFCSVHGFAKVILMQKHNLHCACLVSRMSDSSRLPVHISL